MASVHFLYLITILSFWCFKLYVTQSFDPADVSYFFHAATSVTFSRDKK